MRIIAGTRRGMKLLSPKTDVSRPITDRVKESLFDVLYSNYKLPAGKIVADLFCGVGSLGLEALSRGAEFVSFVEKDPKIAAILERNIEKAGFVKDSQALMADAFSIGAGAAPDERRYDLVFVDPPYAATSDVQQGSLLDRLFDVLQGQLVPGGIVVVRVYKETGLLEQYGRLKIIERRQWGTMALTILRQGGE